jgi:hypothetical protein
VFAFNAFSSTNILLWFTLQVQSNHGRLHDVWTDTLQVGALTYPSHLPARKVCLRAPPPPSLSESPVDGVACRTACGRRALVSPNPPAQSVPHVRYTIYTYHSPFHLFPVLEHMRVYAHRSLVTRPPGGSLRSACPRLRPVPPDLPDSCTISHTYALPAPAFLPMRTTRLDA